MKEGAGSLGASSGPSGDATSTEPLGLGSRQPGLTRGGLAFGYCFTCLTQCWLFWTANLSSCQTRSPWPVYEGLVHVKSELAAPHDKAGQRDVLG